MRLGSAHATYRKSPARHTQPTGLALRSSRRKLARKNGGATVLDRIAYDLTDGAVVSGARQRNRELFGVHDAPVFGGICRTPRGRDAAVQKTTRGTAVVPPANLLGSRRICEFDPEVFLSTISEGRKSFVVGKKHAIFMQGEGADALFYLQKGRVRLTVVSKVGKEATVSMLSEGNFFGEGSLAGQPLRVGSATAMTDCQLLRIEKKSMMDALRHERAFSEMFMGHLLARNIRYEEDLVDHLFNSSEKRLARILLLLAHFDTDAVREVAIPKISQETLAEMIGTTRSRVSFFMNRFRKLGFIQYDGRAKSRLQIHRSLLNIVLHDSVGRGFHGTDFLCNSASVRLTPGIDESVPVSRQFCPIR